MGKKLKGKDLLNIGFPNNNSVNIALGVISRFFKKSTKESVLSQAEKVLNSPETYLGHGIWGRAADSLKNPVKVSRHQLRTNRAPYHIFGKDEMADSAKYQLYGALKLPITLSGAFMPDAHTGYGLPVGGVLATENAVIPYAVGLDIGCRMSLSVYPIDSSYIRGHSESLLNILKKNTRFGFMETHNVKNDHEIFSRKEFNEIQLLTKLKTKAFKQLGTSGGGNHFVEFGEVRFTDPTNQFDLDDGKYLGLLSHSGSRGLGAGIAKHYSYLACKTCPLPKQVQHLAWLDLNTHDGIEYWLAMNLAGDYAKACHHDIHARISKSLGTRPIVNIENHHNFAWKETINGVEQIVHRKGATPANNDELGIIPGSMTAPGFIVRGKGNQQSIRSASHGAGRLYSRNDCKNRFTKAEMVKILKSKGVTLIGGGIDESPMAYKDINTVMNCQSDLVEIIGTFSPKIVRMNH